VVAAIAPPLQPLFPAVDLGLDALVRCTETLEAIKQSNREFIRQKYPDHGQRARILKSALWLLPEDEAEYDLEVKTARSCVELTPALRPLLLALTREETEEVLPDSVVRTLTGTLYLIEVGTGQRHLGIMVQNRRIPCYFPLEYEAVVPELIPGSIVEIEGRATFNERGEVERFEEVLDARPVQIGPLFLMRIVYDSRRFRLREPIRVESNFSEGIWVHEFPPLGIHAFGASRAESLKAFRMDFAACWDLLASEKDENLTGDAQDLKAKLLALVEDVEQIA
jgi:hypothetical protein